tara:strand:+ start:306 stop:542 length:237 start_codon:yes stop_codon:yes gene_type:complete
MAIIYKLIDSKSLVMCEECLDEHGPVAGKWEESPLEECSICGVRDQDARDEYEDWSSEIEQRDYDDSGAYGDPYGIEF